MKPNLFQRGIFTKYPNTSSTKTPEEYAKYMQKVAIILIIIGSLLLLYDYRHLFVLKSQDKESYSALSNGKYENKPNN